GGVGDAVIERDGSTDRFKREEGDGAERGVGDAGGGPAPRALCGESQRVIFQRLVGNPLIILAPDAVYPLPPCHRIELLPWRSVRSPLRRGARLPRKIRAKTYVAILRCNIRDPAYLCSAQK